MSTRSKSKDDPNFELLQLDNTSRKPKVIKQRSSTTRTPTTTAAVSITTPTNSNITNTEETHSASNIFPEHLQQIMDPDRAIDQGNVEEEDSPFDRSTDGESLIQNLPKAQGPPRNVRPTPPPPLTATTAKGGQSFYVSVTEGNVTDIPITGTASTSSSNNANNVNPDGNLTTSTGQTVIPQNNVAPPNNVFPQNNVAPKNNVAPQNNIAPPSLLYAPPAPPPSAFVGTSHMVPNLSTVYTAPFVTTAQNGMITSTVQAPPMQYAPFAPYQFQAPTA